MATHLTVHIRVRFAKLLYVPALLCWLRVITPTTYARWQMQLLRWLVQIESV
jgi:hypothetical protein